MILVAHGIPAVSDVDILAILPAKPEMSRGPAAARLTVDLITGVTTGGGVAIGDGVLRNDVSVSLHRRAPAPRSASSLSVVLSVEAQPGSHSIALGRHRR